MKKSILIVIVMLVQIAFVFAQDDVSRTIFEKDGTIRFSEETVKLLADSNYRAEVYPVSYRLDQIPVLLESKEILRALWTLINVFPHDNQQAGTIAGILAQKGVRGQHYLEAFYTYVFADPEIIHFENKSAYLNDPLRIEQKLESCRTLVVFTEKLANSSDDTNDSSTFPKTN